MQSIPAFPSYPRLRLEDRALLHVQELGGPEGVRIHQRWDLPNSAACLKRVFAFLGRNPSSVAWYVFSCVWRFVRLPLRRCSDRMHTTTAAAYR